MVDEKIKKAKYRTRKGLREAGYDEDTIREIVDSVDWDTATPLGVLSQYIETDALPHLRGLKAQETPRRSTGAPDQGGTSSWWPIGIVVAVIGALIGVPWWLSRKV